MNGGLGGGGTGLWGLGRAADRNPFRSVICQYTIHPFYEDRPGPPLLASAMTSSIRSRPPPGPAFC
jgi:hypothetical protein